MVPLIWGQFHVNLITTNVYQLIWLFNTHFPGKIFENAVYFLIILIDF